MLEAAIAFGTAGAFLASCRWIRVDPLDRLGQVSGLASLGLRFTLASLALVALLWFVRSRPAWFAPTLRLVCAALAGLTGGFLAGGLRVALQGTPWCLFGDQGDARTLAGLADWVRGLHYGQARGSYPPIPVYVLAGYGELFGLPSGFAMKHLEILGTACFAPLAYLSWRTLLRPLWALGIGVVAVLPLVDPYKPYANLVLVAFVPLVVGFLQHLRASGERSARGELRPAALFGAGFALLCLTYPGWFRWSAPGCLVGTLLFFPWRRAAWRAGATFLGTTGAVFVALCGAYLVPALTRGIEDRYVYFDALTDPAYFAMWRWDMPGSVASWPPLGELGGVGLFTVLLAVGLALALAYGRGKTAVTALGLLVASAWVLRLWYAHELWQTKLVQLYPRTSIQILHGSLLLCGYAVLGLARTPRGSAAESQARATSLGSVCGLVLVLGSSASALSDRYMPVPQEQGAAPSYGVLAWRAHERAHAGDPVDERRQRLLERLRGAFGDHEFDVAQAAERCVVERSSAALRDELVHDLTRRLPEALRNARDVVTGDLLLVQAGSAQDGRELWRVEQR